MAQSTWTQICKGLCIHSFGNATLLTLCDRDESGNIWASSNEPAKLANKAVHQNQFIFRAVKCCHQTCLFVLLNDNKMHLQAPLSSSSEPSVSHHVLQSNGEFDVCQHCCCWQPADAAGSGCLDFRLQVANWVIAFWSPNKRSTINNKTCRCTSWCSDLKKA